MRKTLMACMLAVTLPAATWGTEMKLRAVPFSALDGWATDRIEAAIGPFRDSCEAMLAGVPTDPPERPEAAGPKAPWEDICHAFLSSLRSGDLGREGFRAFLERHFQPYAVADGTGDGEGLITGYFEPEVTGSLTRRASDQVPLYRPPPTERLRRQSRADIAAGGLDGQGLELVWLDSAIDAFFLDIQGSAAIRLPSGAVRRVRYVRFNGFPYTPIGRVLVEWGEIPLDEITMQSIVGWMQANPDRRQALMNNNRSYVYFDWLDRSAPQGSQGTDLTPGRSLAIDPRFIPYGAPVWLETTHPLEARPLNRLMLAHDKGGAIKGPVRADFFWGTDAEAAAPAGRMKQSGRYFVFLPKAVRVPSALLSR